MKLAAYLKVLVGYQVQAACEPTQAQQVSGYIAISAEADKPVHLYQAGVRSVHREPVKNKVGAGLRWRYHGFVGCWPVGHEAAAEAAMLKLKRDVPGLYKAHLVVRSINDVAGRH